jgi:hypothetical protein
MYLKTPGSTKVKIYNLYDVYIPPPPKNKQEIQGWDLTRSKQIWTRTPMPLWYNERREEEEYKQKEEEKLVKEGELKRVTYVDPACEQYRRQQWTKRIYGHWVMINGEMVYLSPEHWGYLQWAKGDHQDNDGYPIFYRPQVPRFYFRRLCMEDPFCLGYFIVGPRGFGKTTEESWCQLNNMTMPPHNRHAAIQSKTKEDAIDVVFKEKMVLQFNNLPHFFKPKYSHGTDPQKAMIFKRDSKGGEGKADVKFGEEFELGNTIKTFSAKEKALDGKTLADVIHDEVGKTDPAKEADVYDRVRVVRKSVFRNNFKTGIIRATSTVEEMKKGGAQAARLYNESDPRVRDGNGYTKSGLYRLCISGMQTMSSIVNEFGDIDPVEAEKIIDAERELYKGDIVELSKRIRMNPKNEYEAFLGDQEDSIFDVFILKDLRTRLEATPTSDLGRRGDFEWVNEKDGDVVFVDNPQGKFFIFDWPDAMRGNRRVLNACEKYYKPGDDKPYYRPKNDDLYTGGCDPIKWKKSKDKRASKMAAYGFRRFDPTVDQDKNILEWLSHNLLWRYYGRSADPNDDYENVIKAMRYFGHRINCENNTNEFSKHVWDRGYWDYMIVRKDFDTSVLAGKTKNAISREAPVNTGDEMINAFIQRIIQFLLVHGRRLKDLDLVLQLCEYDRNNQTKSDLVIAFGYALVALDHIINPDYVHQVYEEVSGNSPIRHWAPKYDISGNSSVPLNGDGYGTGDGTKDSCVIELERMVNGR